MADGEERSVPDREVAPPLTPLIWITAAVSSVSVVPLWLFQLPARGWLSAGMAYGLAAVLLSALAAAVIGVPVLKACVRLGWLQWWQAALAGALAASISPMLGALVLSLLQLQPDIARRVLTRSSEFFSSPMTPLLVIIGVTSALCYWALLISRHKSIAQRPGQVSVAFVAVAVLLVSVGTRAEMARGRERARVNAARSVGAPPARRGPLFVQLLRTATGNSAEVRLASQTRPQCAIVIESKDLAAAVAIGEAVAVDLVEVGARTPEARLEIQRVGTLTDASLFRSVSIDTCRPWN